MCTWCVCMVSVWSSERESDGVCVNRGEESLAVELTGANIHECKICAYNVMFVSLFVLYEDLTD